LPCLKHTIPGIAEDFERDQVMIVCAWCFDARELAANFLMGDVRNRTSKRKAVEEPLISISGALAPALLFVLNEELYGLTVRSVCGRTFPRVNSARSLRASVRATAIVQSCSGGSGASKRGFWTLLERLDNRTSLP